MRPIRRLTTGLLLLAGSLLTAGTSLAQPPGPDSVFYMLSGPVSEFEAGCFGPCACPVLVQAPMTGGFLLRRSHADPLYTYYDVLNVRWKAPEVQGTTSIVGTGTYRLGGEVARMEELTLDVSFDGGPAQHFDSGLRPPGAAFPEIDLRASLHGESCHDSVLAIDAKPIGVAAVPRSTVDLRLTASPNPFLHTADIDFVLPQEGPVTLRVFDISGRYVHTLVDREWLPAGAYRRVWRPEAGTGRAVPAGIYFARIEFHGRTLTRRIVALP